MKLLSILGARPQFVKAAPVVRAVERHNRGAGEAIDHRLLHTGQHYDDAMSELFFSELDLPAATVNLGVGSASHAKQTGRMMTAIEEDLLRERELLSDPKELAEHIMLVDLGRNDVGRVAEIGSVSVDELQVIERYSHVMHIVSNVRGKLREDLDWLDLLRATFPAGTLSGAPKVRAMEIIDELETLRRGPYGGCIGYVDYSGNMDMAITIRTLLVKDDTIHLQAGGGVVADSVPEAEYQESVNKAQALVQAIVLAREGAD